MSTLPLDHRSRAFPGVKGQAYDTDHLLAVNAEVRECGDLHLHTYVHVYDWVLEAQEGIYLCLPGEVTGKKGTN